MSDAPYIHDGMQYDPIQGEGHELFKVLPFSKAISSIYNKWELATDH